MLSRGEQARSVAATTSPALRPLSTTLLDLACPVDPVLSVAGEASLLVLLTSKPEMGSAHAFLIQYHGTPCA